LFAYRCWRQVTAHSFGIAWQQDVVSTAGIRCSAGTLVSLIPF
jgi:hypothetical protein